MDKQARPHPEFSWQIARMRPNKESHYASQISQRPSSFELPSPSSKKASSTPPVSDKPPISDAQFFSEAGFTGALNGPDVPLPSKRELEKQFAASAANPESEVIRCLKITTGLCDKKKWPDALVSMAVHKAELAQVTECIRISMPVEGFDEQLILRALDHAAGFLRGNLSAIMADAKGFTFAHYDEVTTEAAGRDVEGVKDDKPSTWPTDRFWRGMIDLKLAAMCGFMKGVHPDSQPMLLQRFASKNSADVIVLANEFAAMMNAATKKKGAEHVEE